MPLAKSEKIAFIMQKLWTVFWARRKRNTCVSDAYSPADFHTRPCSTRSR